MYSLSHSLKTGFQTGNLKLENYGDTEKRRWDGSFLIGGPQLNSLQELLSDHLVGGMWNDPPFQTLEYSLIFKEGF